MKKLLCFVVGVGVGFVIAHKMDHAHEGKHFFDCLCRKGRAFGIALCDGYRERDAERRSADKGAEQTGDSK